MWDVSQCHAATQQVCRGRVSFKTHCAADRQRGTSTKHCCYAPHWLLWQPTGKTFPQREKKKPKKDGGRVQRKRREMRSERQKEKRGEEGQRRERKPQTDKKGGWEERREKKQIYFFLLMYYFWSICSNNTESCHARNKASEIWGVIRREHQRKGGELLARRQGCGCGTIMETPVQSLLSGTAVQQTLHLRNLRV